MYADGFFYPSVLLVAGEQFRARDVISRDQPLDFIEHGRRIERAEFWLKTMSPQPHRVAVGFAGLSAARLAHISPSRTAKRHQSAHIEAHAMGDADHHLEIALGAVYVTGFFQKLQVATCISKRAGFLVRVAGWAHHLRHH